MPRRAGAGLELGQLPRVLLVSESTIDFNRALIEANVQGFAYGFDRIAGYPAAIPCLSFIAEHEKHLRQAFEYFEEWGSQSDGDSVDLNLLLKQDGGYLLGVQPNPERLMYRLARDREMIDFIYAGALWVKQLDTTNPMLWHWKELFASRMVPVQVLAAIAPARRGGPTPDSVTPLDVRAFVKFGIKIETEAEQPDHQFLRLTQNRLRPDKPQLEKEAPEQVSRRRKRLINSVFPVSIVRMRQAGLFQATRIRLASIEVADAQIEQAIINVMLSREWSNGNDGYLGVADVHQTWWERLSNRVEVAGENDNMCFIDPDAVIAQLELDVEHTVRNHGAAVAPKFLANQRLFMRLGYGNS